MTCKCISEMNAALKEHNTVLVTTLFRDPDVCVVATDRIQRLRNGKKAALVIASYCPFCGGKYADAMPGVVTPVSSSNLENHHG